MYSCVLQKIVNFALSLQSVDEGVAEYFRLRSYPQS